MVSVIALMECLGRRLGMVRDTTTEHAVPDPDEPDASLPGEMRAEIKRVFAAGNALVEALVEKRNVEPVPKTLYHYTDGAGLRGIIKSGTLRCGDIFYLNDPSELRHGVGSAFDILGEFAKRRPSVRRWRSSHVCSRACSAAALSG
jgi:hypothetical protein